MLLSSSNARGARGNSKSSRGSRGRGQAGRGASSNASASLSSSATTSVDPFEKERLENAAKREQRGQNGSATNNRGRGSSRGGLQSNKQVRFATPSTEEQTGSPASATSSDMKTSFGSGSATSTISNPFAFTANKNPGTSSNIFVAPTGPNSTSPSPSPFAPSSNSTTPDTSVFGSVSTRQSTAVNPFASTNAFGGASSSSSFGSPSSASAAPLSALINSQKAGIVKGGKSAPSKQASIEKKPDRNSQKNASSKPSQATNGFSDKKNKASNQSKSGFGNTTPVSSEMASFASSSELASKISTLLQKENITPPRCTAKNPGDPRERAAVKSYLDELKKYRTRVRASLIQGGFIDDPLKPKKLSEAIDFKGTCDQMCPEEEIIRRIIEDDVQRAEKEVAPDGSMRPSPQMMIKKLARSAAGEDAPLPQDVRSPAALRRTLDYLIDTVLGEDDNLAAQHEFLWDRTRAIRRDFVFQSSMSPPELTDQVYCLEKITRFHVTALHQMSKPDVAPENFVEQQEVEQLSKSLLSLIHAYEDCNLQNISCENEAEFRAYYVLLNSSNPGILETVQNWGWRFWGESEQIKIAVSLVECLQNIWSPRGPLQPFSVLNVAENAFSRFFTILKGRNVSYTMACFAEMHFNEVRKNALKTILSAYQRQRDQPKDWNIGKLNQYLHFDDPWDIVDFGEAYGLRFDEVDGDYCLSLAVDNQVVDPFPPIKQPHSGEVVERKRNGHTLTEVIDTTVYEGVSADTKQGEESSSDDGLFVKDNIGGVKPLPQAATFAEPSEAAGFQVAQIPPQQALPTSPAAPLFGFPFTGQTNSAQPETTLFSTKKPKDTIAPSTLSAPSPVTAPTPFAPLALFAPTSTNNPSEPKTTEPPKFIWPSDNATFPKPFQPTPIEPPKFSWPSDKATFPSVPPTTSAESTKPFQPTETTAFKPPAPEPQFTRPKLNDWNSSSKPVLQSVSSEPVAPPSVAKSAKVTTFTPTPKPDLSNLFRPVAKETPQPDIQVPTLQVSPLDNFAKWIALGEDGIIEQFMTYTVQNLVGETMDKFMRDEAKKARKEAKRIAEEEEELARQEADDFRSKALAVKYISMWRTNAHNLWVRRQGSKARRARIEHAESMRASKTALSASVVEDFRLSTSKGKKRVKSSPSKDRRSSLGSLLEGTGVLVGVHNPQEKIREIVYNGETERSNKRLKSSVSSIASDSTSKSQRRNQSDNPLQRSILSDPSFLNGGSRIHFFSSYQAAYETRPQLSGVQTDYFRLKARGITTLPNGTPLATSVAKDPLRQKKSFDGVSKPIRSRTLMMPKEQPIPRSSPARVPAQQLLPPAPTGDEEINRLKERARVVMAAGSGRRSQNSGLDDDDDLFERARRIREKMDEDSEWLRREVNRYSESRSGSWS